MRVFDILLQLELLCCHSVVFGLKKGYVNKDDLIKYAILKLDQKSYSDDYELAVLAGGENNNKAELERVMISYCEKNGQLPMTTQEEKKAADKWRLAFLVQLDESDLTPDEQMIKLQEIYAEFGFPEDMALCSPYSLPKCQEDQSWKIGDQGKSPISAMKEVIKGLKRVFGINN